MHEVIVYLHHLSNFNLIDELHAYEVKSNFGYIFIHEKSKTLLYQQSSCYNLVEKANLFLSVTVVLDLGLVYC